MNPDMSDSKILKPCLLSQGNKNPAVIVCPGGAYLRQALHEGLPVAQWLNSIGLSAFILYYRVTPDHYPAPLDDIRNAVCHVRENAGEYNIDPDRLGVLGFSAGGHLACLLATEKGNAKKAGQKIWARPDFAVLCYPVISFTKYAHEGSVKNLLGKNPDASLLEELSCQNRVSAETPMVFVWHTVDDAAVPVENSLLLAESLCTHNIPFAMHLFQEGKHGLGLGEEASPDVRRWPKLCEDWLRQVKILQ